MTAEPGRGERFWWLPLIPAATGVAASVVFDFAPVPAINDDWLYSWDVRHLLATHALKLFPDQEPLALFQVFWGALISLGRGDSALLRLSTLPFLVLAAYATWRLSRRMGAQKFWAAVTAAVVCTNPIVMYLATSFHTDVFYLGFAMAALWCSALWLEDGKARTAFVALSALATVERQVGAALVLIGLLVLVLRRRRGSGTGKDLVACLAAGAAGAGILVLPFITGLATPMMAGGRVRHGIESAVTAERAILTFGPMLGLLALPFLAAAMTARLPRTGRPSIIAIALGAAGIGGALIQLLYPAAYSMFFGDVWAASTLGREGMPGNKPPVYPPILFNAVSVLAVACFASLLIWRARMWTMRNLTLLGGVLVAFAMTQLAGAAATDRFDRYYIPIAIPLLPVIASSWSRAATSRSARGWALLSVGVAVAAYVIGEQDLMNWQAARDQLARDLYRTVSPLAVNAGYVPNALYAEIPYYERTGRLPPRNLAGNLVLPWAAVGPAQPRYIVCFAPPATAGGRMYRSLGAGSVISEPVSAIVYCTPYRS